MSFDGTDDFVDCGTGLADALGDNYAGSLTVSMWVRLDTSQSNMGLFSIGTSNFSGHGEFDLILHAATVEMRMNQVGYRHIVPLSYKDNWQHLCFLFKQGSTSETGVYIDGVKIAPNSLSGTLPSASDLDFAGRKTIIGGYFDNRFFTQGAIDEVAVWSEALDGDAIRALYNAGLPTPVTTKTGAYDIYRDNLKAYYKMGDASDPAADGTSNLLFDQTSPGVGSELVKEDADLYQTTSWGGNTENVRTFPNGTAARFTRPASGGRATGGFTRLKSGTTERGLTSNLEAGCVYRLQLDFLTDDEDAYPRYFDGANYTNLSAGSGFKMLYFVATGHTNALLSNDALSANKFVEFSNLSVKKVNGHTGTISGATIQTEAPKQIYALAPVDNKFSLNFDGTNDHLVTQVDATAQPNNESRYYSFWAKSSHTTVHTVFSHGGWHVGGFLFFSANSPLLYMASNVYQYWATHVAQTDGNWHHWVVKIKYNDITGCELWCDGVKLTKTGNANSGSMNPYTTGIQIGAASQSNSYFNGSLDEFSIHEELDEEAIRALFNRGRPIDISSNHGAYDLSDKALHYWRMGDATSPAADGTNDIIFQGLEAEGSELVPNGDLSTWTDTDTIATWTHKDSNNNGGGGVISQVGSGEGSGGTGLGSANFFTASPTNMSLTSGTIFQGGITYRLEIEVLSLIHI